MKWLKTLRLSYIIHGIINELDWMDDGTRERTKEKATDMTTHIAYPNK